MKNKLFFDSNDDFSASDVVFRDMISLLLLGFVLMFFILIIFVNPKKEKNEESPIKSPGSLVVLLVWDSNVNIDLDLWGKSPNDYPIGFINRENSSCNLVRDDIGMDNDFFPENFENIFCRNLIPGEYIFNIHFYSMKQTVLKVNYKIEIRYFSSKGGRIEENKILLLKEDVFYPDDVKTERTILRFTVKEDGKIDDNSFNNEFVTLLVPRKNIF